MQLSCVAAERYLLLDRSANFCAIPGSKRIGAKSKNWIASTEWFFRALSIAIRIRYLPSRVWWISKNALPEQAMKRSLPPAAGFAPALPQYANRAEENLAKKFLLR